jgi:hypothetical protein
MQLIKYLKGFSLKDVVSNVAGLTTLSGSLMLINIQSGNMPQKYEKQAQGLVGMGMAIIGFVSGKNGSLNAGQPEDRQ